MKQLKQHYANILANGIKKPGRTGDFNTPDSSFSIFGAMLRFNLKEGLPFTTSKELKVIPMIKEFTWMMRGETNTKTLGCGIWDKWSLDKPLQIRRPKPEITLIQELITKGVIKLEDGEVATLDASQQLPLLTQKGSVFLRDIAKSCYEFPEDVVEEIRQDIINNPIINEDYVNWDKAAAKLLEFGIESYVDTPQYDAGECGPIYGAQWRNFKSVVKRQGQFGILETDQLLSVFDTLLKQKHSRRNVVSAWNPGLIPESGLSIDQNIALGYMGLPPCHKGFQVYVGIDEATGRDNLNLMLELRSSDSGVGLPFNIAAYALILCVYAMEFDFELGELIVVIGDAHVYNDHQDGIKQYIDNPEHALPTFHMPDYEARKQKHINDWARSLYADAKDNAGVPLFDEETVNKLTGDEIAKLSDASDPVVRRARFKVLLDTINVDFFQDTILGYECEPHIPLNLHD